MVNAALWFAAALIVIITLLTLGFYMKTNRAVLFSEVTGTVTRGGRPAAGIEVVRRINDNGAEQPPTTTRTDADGKFRFPQTEDAPRGILDFLPGEFVVGQELIFNVGEGEVVGWIHTRHGSQPNEESAGRAFQLVCDLDSEPQYHDRHFGVCKVASD